jgi:polynucleotide 5'-hydroxyl-kinase GRC3/NOL9
VSVRRDTIVPGPDWTDATKRLTRGVVMVIGEAGTGKSHLSRWLAARAGARAVSAALVSADMGQPSVGVPTCVALATEPPWAEASALWFVGDTTPRAHVLPMVAGTAALVRRARAGGAELVVIDTSGLVAGAMGRAVKYHEAVATGAEDVVVLQRGRELEPLVRVLAGAVARVHRVMPAAPARDRTRAERQDYRHERFRAHFAGATVQRFRRAQLLDLAGSLGSEMPLPGTVLGLLDASGFCLGLGVHVETRRETVDVSTAVRESDAVARLQVGSLRLGPDYDELRGDPITARARGRA